MTDGSAWQVLRDLRDLRAWQITQIPRRPPARHDSVAGQDQEDGLMSAWSGPFAWLVVAEPVANGQLGGRPYGLPRMPLAPGPPAARRAGM